MPSLPVLLPSLGGLLKNCVLPKQLILILPPIQRWMNESMERPSWEDVSPYGPATKAYWSQWQRLYLKDGTLVRRYYLNETPEFYPRLSCREFSGKMSCTRCTRGQWVDISVWSERYSGYRTGIIGTKCERMFHFGVPHAPAVLQRLDH